MAAKDRYTKLIERVFSEKFKKGAKRVPFHREDLTAVASSLNVKLPSNIGDVVYSFRYRKAFPSAIASKAPKGHEWIILPAGQSKYVFVATTLAWVEPNPGLVETKIPDATPGVISRYALSDEQALLARVRYNRLIDVFSGLSCYPLQSHLRTTVKELGQVETDDLYVGVNRNGAHFVLPVQAKGGSDTLSIVQVWQDWRMAMEKFPNLICRPIAAQFMSDNLIALFEFSPSGELLKIESEKHYLLVDQAELTDEELKRYRDLVV